MSNHDHGHDHGEPEHTIDVPADTSPRRLHGWDYQGTHTEIMPDCVASGSNEGLFIAESTDGTVAFVVIRNWTLLQLDPAHAVTSNQPRLFDVANYATPLNQDG